MRHGSLFSGIGGFDLAAEWMGWENVFHCEWNEFGQRVLKYHFPKSISYNDITKTDFTIHRGQIDIITGGFPCQPYSTAGKRLGKADDRHLWPEMLRAIREIQPTWVVGENVRGLTNWNGGMVFDEVQADLEAEGYEVTPFLLPACAVNAPHRRDRIWFIAHSNYIRSSKSKKSAQQQRRAQIRAAGEKFTLKNPLRNGRLRGELIEEGAEVWKQRNARAGGEKRVYLREGVIADAEGVKNIRRGQGRFYSEPSGVDAERYATDTENTEQPPRIDRQREKQLRGGDGTMGERQWQRFPTQPPVCGGDDGLSRELDGITFSKWRSESIKAYGNAIVPQVALQIFKAISQYENN